MSRHTLVAVVCFTFAASANPASAQVIPRVVPTVPVVPVMPVVPIVPMHVPLPAPTIRVPIHVHTPPLPQPPIPPLDSTRGGPSLTPTTTPTIDIDLRGTLPSTGGSTPSVHESPAEPSDVDFTAPRRVSEPATTYADPAAEARDAQTRGVALHPGGPPPKDKDNDDDDQEEGSNWWLWVLLVIGVLMVSSWVRKGR